MMTLPVVMSPPASIGVKASLAVVMVLLAILSLVIWLLPRSAFMTPPFAISVVPTAPAEICRLFQ